MMTGKVDLHIHTTYSDGSYTPGQVVRMAKNAGLDIISITDHDSLNGLPEAIETAKEFGIEVIPGVEISSDMGDREVHILAYFVEQDNSELERYLSFFREERIKRADRIVKRLRSLGLSITLDDVMDIAQNCAVGRPHIAQAMLAKNLVSSYFEAFNKYIGNGGPAYERKVHISPTSAFKIINDAGGLSFIAHPGYMPETVIKDLIEAGVDGIEVLHPSHSHQQVRFYRGIVNEYFLLESGGSDFHGGKRDDEKNLGNYSVRFSALDEMRSRLHRNSA
jgi:3',5'-nucleoside bisphosphate phosphatase